MKLDEFKQIEERWGVTDVNQHGTARLTALKNRLTGSPDADLDATELRAKQIFIGNFVKKASADLENAIKTGTLSANSQPAQGQAQQPAQAQQGQPAQPAQAGQLQQTPAQVRQAKQAQAGVAAQSQMTPKPGQTTAGQPANWKPQGSPAVWRNNRTQQPGTQGQPTSGQVTPKPGQAPAKMTPQQTAALKGRLKAGATSTSAQSGFKNYVGGSGERMTGVDKSGAPVFKKIQRENKYQLLDAIFESILNEQSPSISNFVMDTFKSFAQGPGLSDPALMQKAQQLADEVQATYPKDKGVAALQKLGDVGYRVASAAEQPTAGQQGSAEEPAGQGQPGQPAQGGANTKQVYQEISKLLDSLDSASQQKVVNGLEKYVQMHSV